MKKRKYDTKTTLDRPQRWLSSSSGTTTNNNKLKKKTIDNKSGVRRCNYADADYGKQKRNGSQSDIRPNKNSSVDRTAKILSLALPYLDDRKDWNNVCLTSKRIHHKIHDNPCLIFPWPVDIDMKLPTETLQANSRMKVQCSFAPDGKHLICLLCVVSCPGWYNDDDKEVESRHSVSIFHRKDGLVQKIRLKDNMDNGWSDGPCDFRKVVMSSNGCRLFLQRRSSDQIHALSVSEDFKSFDLSDFFDGVSDEIFMNNDFSNTVAVSSDGSKFVGVNTKKGGKFTAVSIDEDTGNCKSLLPTFRSGYHLSIAPLDVSFCPDDDSVAILVDRDVNDSGYGPFMQTVAVFNPKEESAEYYWCDLASSPDRFGFQDYYDGIGIDYSPNGSILAGVVREMVSSLLTLPPYPN